MPENQMPEDEKTDLAKGASQRVMQGAEAVDSIKDARQHLAAAGGFSSTIATLDGVVTQIRADTGYEGGEPEEE